MPLLCSGRPRLSRASGIALSALLLCGSGVGARAQSPDCGRLQAQIAQADRGGAGSARAIRRQASELARTQAYAHQLGCDGFSFFGANPQCSAVNNRIEGLKAGMAQLQAGGGGVRDELVARFNAYCRGAPPQAPQPRGFFESIFGGEQPQQGAVPQAPPPAPADPREATDEQGYARGGSQAVCVRTCDGGFFPLSISARRGAESLTEMCQALCPGTETAVYTRNPDNDIKTAAALDGKPYMSLPNALKFQKSFTPACSCRPTGKSWAETLANAEEVLGNSRKGDIMVTPEKSAELSRPRLDAKVKASPLDPAPATKASTADAAALAGDANRAHDGASSDDPLAKRSVRKVGPQP